MKVEIILDNIHNILIFASIVETILFSTTFSFLLRAPKKMYYIVMHVPHLAHAFYGMMLFKNIPTSDELIELVKPEEV